MGFPIKKIVFAIIIFVVTSLILLFLVNIVAYYGFSSCTAFSSKIETSFALSKDLCASGTVFQRQPGMMCPCYCCIPMIPFYIYMLYLISIPFIITSAVMLKRYRNYPRKILLLIPLILIPLLLFVFVLPIIRAL